MLTESRSTSFLAAWPAILEDALRRAETEEGSHDPPLPARRRPEPGRAARGPRSGPATSRRARDAYQPFHGAKAVALIFDKPTLRTQVSFTAGVAELGGMPMVVDGNLAEIGTRESIADTARVLGRQVAAIVWRTYGQDRIEEMAAYAGVPVVNALTDEFHPCQLLADLLTVTEHKGALAGLTLAFLGDAASNMAHSYLLACAPAGMHVVVSGPAGFTPDPAVLAQRRGDRRGDRWLGVAGGRTRSRPSRRRRGGHRHLGLDGQGGRGRRACPRRSCPTR